MNDKPHVTTAYTLPFGVKYATAPIFSSGGIIELIADVKYQREFNRNAAGQILKVFTDLARTGALAGKDIEPWRSGLRSGSPRFSGGQEIYFTFLDCSVDDRALIVLTHLFLARQEGIPLLSLELAPPTGRASQLLQSDPSELSTYPEVYKRLPFTFENEDPESGGYTFTAELEQPLKEQHTETLQNALTSWTEAILAGAYGLAPIRPEECYVEPYEEQVISFGRTVEWTVFKVRADPACINGVVNIFAAFHGRCQKILNLRIS
jgi:hypothetical protein